MRAAEPASRRVTVAGLIAAGVPGERADITYDRRHGGAWAEEGCGLERAQVKSF